jgi:hypothetical protein
MLLTAGSLFLEMLWVLARQVSGSLSVEKALEALQEGGRKN